MTTFPTTRQTYVARALAWTALGAMASCVATPAGPNTRPGKADRFERSERCIHYADAITTGRVRNKDASEISGLAASRHNPGLFWMHNDGAGL